MDLNKVQKNGTSPLKETIHKPTRADHFDIQQCNAASSKEELKYVQVLLRM